MLEVFDLTQNPFHLLGLSIRAGRGEVVEGHEEALADGQADEGVLDRARQAVSTPRTRIEAELSWFPGIPPSEAKEILSKLERSSLADAHDINTRHDYEVPVGACIDYLETCNSVDTSKPAVGGSSLGGYYAARAGCFEYRLAGVISDGAIWSVAEFWQGAGEDHGLATTSNGFSARLP